mmetsp:Transcript_11321/g.17241  ORF Transcript_11321/g.17241 Transcript_11321/m.17241 type:complete len:216 (-) Transcript_11321:205-852(-)
MPRHTLRLLGSLLTRLEKMFFMDTVYQRVRSMVWVQRIPHVWRTERTFSDLLVHAIHWLGITLGISVAWKAVLRSNSILTLLMASVCARVTVVLNLSVRITSRHSLRLDLPLFRHYIRRLAQRYHLLIYQRCHRRCCRQNRQPVVLRSCLQQCQPFLRRKILQKLLLDIQLRPPVERPRSYQLVFLPLLRRITQQYNPQPHQLEYQRDPQHVLLP